MSNPSIFTPLLGNLYKKYGECEHAAALLKDLSRTESGRTIHKERHSKIGDYLGDAVLGFADGLTVPFALTAGLSARVNLSGHRRGTGGVLCGSISMGLGAWLAAESERKGYFVVEAREYREVEECPDKEEEEIYEIFDQYHIPRDASKGVVTVLKANKYVWVQFIMDFELNLARPCSHAGWIGAIVIAIAYYMDGLLPMIPYFIFNEILEALYTSIAITFVILLIFGYAKAVAIGQTHWDADFSAVQMLIVGTLAAGASYGIVGGVNAQIGWA